MTTAYINRVSTATPKHDLHTEFLEFAENSFDNPKTRLLFRRMVERSHVSHRWGHMENLMSFYDGDPDSMGIRARMATFEKEAPKLAVEAVERLELGDLTGQITHLIVITCTGFFTPGIDFAIINSCGVPTTVERTQIAFMGCFSGVNGLKLAHHIVRSEPDAKVIVVALELSSLHLQSTQDLERMLSYTIFGDGCGAALITAEPTGLAIDSFQALVIPETEDLMTLSIGSKCIEMHLSGKVPNELSRSLKNEETMKVVLRGAETNDIDIWAIHPGGRSILDAVGRAIDLTEDDLAISRGVLDSYGNLASATILYVFAEILRQHESGTLQGSSGCALAFGPGLTAETMLFHAT